MKANYTDKMSKATSEIALGNLYDMNKQLMEKAPILTDTEITLAQEHLRNWIANNFKQKYFMLLCHELRDYTLFNLDKTSTWAAAHHKNVQLATSDIVECMTNRGTLVSIEDQPDNTWELWIRNSEGCFAYYLFPYGEAVLEY